VRQGYGHAYNQFPFKYLEMFRELETEASHYKRGLWRESQEVAPSPVDGVKLGRGPQRPVIRRADPRGTLPGCRVAPGSAAHPIVRRDCLEFVLPWPSELGSLTQVEGVAVCGQGSQRPIRVSKLNRMSGGKIREIAILSILVCTACAPRFAKLPLDRAGSPVLSGGDRLEELAGACRAPLVNAGNVNLDGVIAGGRVRARLSYTVMMGGTIRLETRDASSGKQFVFSAVREEATLFLPQDNSVIRGPAFDILNAVFGLPLRASTWERVLVCPMGGRGSFNDSERLPGGWLRVLGRGADGLVVAYLNRSPTRKGRLVAMLGRAEGSSTGWRADFHHRQNNRWRRVRLTSIDWMGRQRRQYDLVLSVEPSQINPTIELSKLSVAVPPTARTVTVEALRGSNLLVESSSR